MAKLSDAHRKILVDALVDDYLNSIANDSGYAEYVVRQGFNAIERRPDDDLIADCRSSGLEYALNAVGLLLSHYVVSYLHLQNAEHVFFFECDGEFIDDAEKKFESWASTCNGDFEKLYVMPRWTYELQPGSQVVWRDPDEGKSSGLYTVVGINSHSQRVEAEDTIIQLRNEAGSEVEVVPCELYQAFHEVDVEVIETNAKQFIKSIAAFKKWEPEDSTSEVDEPSEGAWDSHDCLMSLIDEARDLIGESNASQHHCQTAPTPMLVKGAG